MSLATELGSICHRFVHLHKEWVKEVMLYDSGHIMFGDKTVACTWELKAKANAVIALFFNIRPNVCPKQSVYCLLETIVGGPEAWFCQDHGGQYLIHIEGNTESRFVKGHGQGKVQWALKESEDMLRTDARPLGAVGPLGAVCYRFTHLHGGHVKEVLLYDSAHIKFGNRTVACTWTVANFAIDLHFTIWDDGWPSTSVYKLQASIDGGPETWFCNDHGGQFLIPIAGRTKSQPGNGEGHAGRSADSQGNGQVADLEEEADPQGNGQVADLEEDNADWEVIHQEHPPK